MKGRALSFGETTGLSALAFGAVLFAFGFGGTFVLLEFQSEIRKVVSMCYALPIYWLAVLVFAFFMVGVHHYQVTFLPETRQVEVRRCFFWKTLRKQVYSFDEVESLTVCKDAQGWECLIEVTFADGQHRIFAAPDGVNGQEVKERLVKLIEGGHGGTAAL